MSKFVPQVIISPKLNCPPERHEIETAWILARHYNTTVEFLKPIDDYKRTTPDIVMDGTMWEIKNPEGSAARNIQRQIKKALKQSRNIVFDSKRSGIRDDVIENRLRFEAQRRHSIRRLIFINKKQEIIEIVWK